MREPQQIGALAIKAIATTYRQYEFRSRLEAKWAAFFDLCHWPWSYEPVDLNGWIPDFAIGERPTLVEVKPFFRKEEFTDAKTKIFQSGHKSEVILLGNDPVWIANAIESYSAAPVFGWLLRHGGMHDGHDVWDTEDLHFGITEGNRRPGLCTLDGAWQNQIWTPPKNAYSNKWSRVNLPFHDQEHELVERWATACNISKWVPCGQRS
jgi:hypothetical protein